MFGETTFEPLIPFDLILHTNACGDDDDASNKKNAKMLNYPLSEPLFIALKSTQTDVDAS